MPPLTENQGDRRISSAPAYQRIADDLRNRLASGEWQIGAMLPSRRTLAKEYGVELMTMQRAISGLLTDGLLRADGGRGTFVADSPALSGAPANIAGAGAAQAYGHSAATTLAGTVIGVVADPSSFSHGENQWATWKTSVIHALERFIADEDEVFVRGVTDRDDAGNPLTIPERVSRLLESGVNALVLVFADSELTAVRSTVDTEAFPTVFVGSNDIGAGAMNVFYDSHTAGYHAARHLIDQGYSDLIFVSPFQADFVQARLEGARQAVEHCASAGATLHEEVGSLDASNLEDSHEELGKRQTAALLAVIPGRGIVAVNDHVACGIMQAASASNLTAGIDYAIVGFDDVAESRVVGLTTLHPPLDAMGAEAGRLILDALRGQHHPMQIRLRSYLIARSSTARRQS